VETADVAGEAETKVSSTGEAMEEGQPVVEVAGTESGVHGAVEGVEEGEQVVESVVEEKRTTRKRKADDQTEESKGTKK